MQFRWLVFPCLVAGMLSCGGGGGGGSSSSTPVAALTRVAGLWYGNVDGTSGIGASSASGQMCLCAPGQQNSEVVVGQLAETDYEVSLKLEGKAEASGTVLFAFDLNYGGVFRLTNIPQENIGPLLMIECPRLLFPFARELIASAISNGGFPR